MQDKPTNVKFHEERLTGFGGSDAGNYMAAEPYGCTRALVYAKAQVTADYPFEGNDATDRGTFLEDPAGKLYAAKTGRRIERRLNLRRDKNDPHLILHIDRHIVSGDKNVAVGGEILPGPGILEIKTMGERAYRKFLEYGIPAKYSLQLQHALAVTGYAWGSFAVYWPDGHQVRYWDVMRDDALIAGMREKAAWAWGRVEATRAAITHLTVLKDTGAADGDLLNATRAVEDELPERLPAYSQACKSCQWRTTCQGEAILERFAEDGFDSKVDHDESIAPLVREYKRLKADLKPRLERMGQVERELCVAMDQRASAACSAGTVSYRPQRKGKAIFRVLRVR